MMEYSCDNACGGWGCVDGYGDCTSYTLDPYTQPGVVVVMVENHPTYLAENFHQGEVFAQRLLDTAPILLAAPNDAEALIARVLARVQSATP